MENVTTEQNQDTRINSTDNIWKADWDAQKERLQETLFIALKTLLDQKRTPEDHVRETNKLKQKIMDNKEGDYPNSKDCDEIIRDIECKILMGVRNNILERKFTIMDAKKTEYIYEEFIPKGEAVILSGLPDVGKTRSMLWMLSQTHRHFIYVDSENAFNQATVPSIFALNVEKFIHLVPSKRLYPDENLTYLPDKIEDHLMKLRQVIERYKGDVFFDRFPSFVDWNKEKARPLFEGYQEIARETGYTIIGGRNDGKNRDFSDIHLAKGSTAALADPARMIIHAVKCDAESIIGKKYKDSTILYHAKNSLGPKQGYIFTKNMIDVEVPKKDDPKTILRTVDVCVFSKKEAIKPELMNNIKALYKADDKSLTAMIKAFITQEGAVNDEELYSNFSHKDRSSIRRIKNREIEKNNINRDEKSGLMTIDPNNS